MGDENRPRACPHHLLPAYAMSVPAYAMSGTAYAMSGTAYAMSVPAHVPVPDIAAIRFVSTGYHHHTRCPSPSYALSVLDIYA
eukprot:3538818-Rhodomonas_salina.3